MATPPGTDEWLSWMLTTSAPLRRFDASGALLAAASGALLDFEGHRFLLSVAHAVPRGTDGWALELGLDSVKGTEVWHLGPFAYAAEFQRGAQAIQELDLCAVEIPSDVSGLYEYRTPRGLFDQRPRHVFTLPAAGAAPDRNSVYAFSGQVRREQHSSTTFAAEMVVYPGLKYLCSEREVQVYELPVPHPGHEAFEGCSGSPLVSFGRQAVALVTGGDLASNTVRAISIAHAMPMLQFLLRRQAARSDA